MSLFKSQEELDLTEGGILKPLFYLSLPIVVTNLLQTAYNLADTFWLGRYSTEALAAISFGFPMVFLLISMGIGLSIAGSVLVAQHIGAGEREQAEYAASQTVTFALVGSALLGAFAFPFVRPLLRFMGASPDVLPGATAYMQVIALGLPFMFGFFVFISLMRGSGDTVTPMFVMLGTVIVNVVLDPFLINGWTVLADAPLVGTVAFPEMGIEGAAVATVFSRMLAMAVGIAIMLRGDQGIQINPGEMWPDLGYVRKILAIGVPASVEVTGRALSVNALLVVVGLFSTPVVAAFGIGTRVLSVIFLPAIAIAQGVETMAGQNVGAGELDRAERTSNLAALGLFGVLTAAGVVIFLVPRPIVAVFTDDPAVLAEGTAFLRFVALSFGFTGVMRAFSGGFRGAGETLTSAAIQITTLGAVRLPVAWVASQALLPTSWWFFGAVDPRGIWLSFLVSNVFGAVLAFAWYRRGTWRRGDVRETSGAGPAPDVDGVAGGDDGDDAADESVPPAEPDSSLTDD